MNPDHTPTARPLGEWLDLMEKCNRLERELFESRKATECVRSEAADARQKYHAELTRRGDTVAELLVKLNDRTNHARFNAGALVETLTALRRLLAALDQYDRTAHDPGARRVLDKIVNEARECITKYDIPFGHEGEELNVSPIA